MVDIKIELPKGYLEEENRSGYIVSPQMKKIWAVELDLLHEFDCICKKNELQYFADGGTLLGAVRHKGFIPWDDDIDLVMMRDDYDKLCEIAANEFRYPYFFQTEYSDPSSLRGHAQLRNSETTGILSSELEGVHNFNQGIFIDIFPLDSVPADKEAFNKKIRNREKYLRKARSLANLTDRYTPTPKGKPVRAIAKKTIHALLSKPLRGLVNYDKYYDMYESECRKGNEDDTLMVAKYFCIPFHKGQVWFREDFSDYEIMDFEMLSIPVPVGYRRILDVFFGNDWMTPKKIPTYHSGVLFDTDRPYTDYINDDK